MSIHHINEGTGKLLVFQHGLGSDITQSQRLLGALPHVRLAGIDCPGHGRSPFPNKMLPSYEFYADQLLQQLDALQIGPAIFGGISMGSGIALNIALRFPERVKGLILVRPAWLDQPTPDNLKILLTAADHMGQPGGKAAFQQLEVFKTMQQQLPNAARSVLGVFAETQQKELPTVLRQLVNDRPFDQLEKIRDIQKPCIILANDDDPLHPYEMAETLHRHLPGSQLHKVTSRYVDDAAHGVAVRALVQQFVKEIG
ncbi:MAG: alpha/beta hydrolase [Bacteroidota bacterium]